ncbi:hypothetical protein GpartN1_g5355.t1 [Galdieria partita]|uniref:ER membrane protein complex subunit 1 n=1 Tax=Galdieria partita TaxID=83374 RepID=A0A9C7Q0H6_9RHOD|nr:hypothetical protein GpartN1_g5355.t1 [Galdieria partita]
MLPSFVGRIAFPFYVVSLFCVALSYGWVWSGIGEPVDIVSVDNKSLLVVSTDGVISKVSKSSGDILWKFIHTEAKKVFVEQLISFDEVVLAFVHIDTLSYAEILNLKTGALEWSCIICFPYDYSDPSSKENQYKQDFQYQKWQLLEDDLAILACSNRIYLYNLRSKAHSLLFYDEPLGLEAFELRLGYSPDSEVPDLCVIFYDKYDSLLSFGCVHFDDLHSRSRFTVLKTACESELHWLTNGQCICKKQDSLILISEQDAQSIEKTVSFNQDFEILMTSSPSHFALIRLKENNSLVSLKVTSEEIQLEELFHSQLLNCHSWSRGKGCSITEDLSNLQTKIQYFTFFEEFESLKWRNYTWIIKRQYFRDPINTLVIPWDKLLCYFSTTEELTCSELTNFGYETKTKLLWKIDFSMTRTVAYQLFTPDSNSCMTFLERILISFYERSIQFLPRTFQLLLHKLFVRYYPDQMFNSVSSMCYSQGLLVTVSRCGAVQTHVLDDSMEKPSLLWKVSLFEEQPRCLDQNDSFAIFALGNDSIVGLWYHRVLYFSNVSSNLYDDCIFYLQMNDGKLLGRHCYYSDVPLKVLSSDASHLLILYKNGTIQWDSYVQASPIMKKNFRIFEVDSNRLNGYELDTALHRTKRLYSLMLSRDEDICLVRTVHSKDVKLQKETVHFSNGSFAKKYLNPYRILIVTKKTLSKTGISVYVLDGSTGNILYDSYHVNGSLPVSGVWTENWFLYSLRNLATSRQEIYVGEMLYSVSSLSSSDDALKYNFLSISSSQGTFETFKEATFQNDSIAQDSFPVMYLQGYEVDIWIRDILVTQTRNGITPQFLLLYSLDGYLFVISKLWFHPRRPFIHDSNTSLSEDVLQNMPYYPNIPLKPVHKQSEPLFFSLGVKQIISYPDSLRESCTIIIGMGIDWVIQRLAPIGQFDSIPDYFPQGQLTCLLLFSFLCLYIVQKWSSSINLKTRWISYFQ